MIKDSTYIRTNFETNESDRPLFIQLCGDDPKILLQAGKMVEKFADAIDLNFGCPQVEVLCQFQNFQRELLKEGIMDPFCLASGI